MAIPILSVFLVIALSVTAILAGLAFGAKATAVRVYGYFGEAMNYAAASANMDGDTSQVALRTDLAKKHFAYAMAAMTETAWNGAEFVPNPNNKAIAGPIKLVEFKPVAPGDPVPGGKAGAPGYVAVIEVPVLGGTYPLIGPQYITVPMKQFGAVVSSRM